MANRQNVVQAPSPAQQGQSCPLGDVCQSYSGRDWDDAKLEQSLVYGQPSLPRIADSDCA